MLIAPPHMQAQNPNETGDFSSPASNEENYAKALESDLRRANDRLEMALSSSGTGTWTYDYRSDRFTLDARAAAIFSLSANEDNLSMQRWLGLIHPDDLRRVEKVLELHTRGEEPNLSLEYRARHQTGGHWVHVKAHGKVYPDHAGEPVQAAGIVRDVSDIKRLEKDGGDLLQKVEALLHDLRKSLDPDRESLARQGQTRHDPAGLSSRHREVLGLIAQGMTSAQIAERLHISHATVLTHRRNLLRKLDAHSVAELTRYAIEHKLVGTTN